MEETVNPNVEQQVQEDIVEKQVKSKNSPLLVILLIFFILLFTSAVYMFFTDQLIIVGLDNPLSSNIEKEEEVEEEETVKEDETTLKYISDENIGITFEFPGTWEITEDRSEYEIFDSGEKFFYLVLEFTNKEDPNYILSYSLPSASGPNVCVFDDTPEEYRDGMQITVFDDYIEFGEGLYRRSDWEDSQVVCYDSSGNGIYSEWVDPGYVHFYIGDDNNQQLINEMVDILLSMESREDLFDNVN